MCCAFSFVMWGCGGVANVCIALHMWCAEHCTCGALHARRARKNRGPRHTSPASCRCFGVKRSGLLVPPANSSRPPIVPQLMEPAADDAQWNGRTPPSLSATRFFLKANSSKKERSPECYISCITYFGRDRPTLCCRYVKMPECDATWAVLRYIYTHRDGDRKRDPRHRRAP